jgi:hypothetical protein
MSRTVAEQVVLVRDGAIVHVPQVAGHTQDCRGTLNAPPTVLPPTIFLCADKVIE